MIPIKDASLIARCDDPAIRREWRSRLVDHDGEHEDDGGIARWLKLTDGLGLDRDYVTSLRGLLPGTRFAVDAYVRFVREKTLLEAIASSLTELFSPVIISERMDGMLAHYDFVTRETLAYFEKRPPQAAKDSDFALDYVKRNARTPDAQAIGSRGAGIQMQRAVGDAGCAASCLCRARTYPARRLRTGRSTMTEAADRTPPSLPTRGHGCRAACGSRITKRKAAGCCSRRNASSRRMRSRSKS